MKLLAGIVAAAAATAGVSAKDLWTVEGHAPAATSMSFHVAMKPQNMDKLDQILMDVSDPASPSYGQYKSLGELNALTASSEDTVRAVKSWLSSAGAVCHDKTGDILACKAKAADVEKMLGARVRVHRNGRTGARVARIVGDATVPAAVREHVRVIVGLRELPVPSKADLDWQHEGVKRSLQGGGDGLPAGSTLDVVPETLSTLYKISAPSNAAATTLGIVEYQSLGAYGAQDLSTFESEMGVSFGVNQTVGPFNQGQPAAESTLDVQYGGSLSQGTGAKVDITYMTYTGWVFEAASSWVSGESSLPSVLSNSYGWSETQQCQIAPNNPNCQSGSQAFVQAVNGLYQKLGAAGHTVMFSSGDAGAHGRSDSLCTGPQVHPAYPASSPYVVGVGATQLAAGAPSGGSAPVCSQVQCASGAAGTTEQVCSTATGALITSGGGFSAYGAALPFEADAVKAYLADPSNGPGSGNFNPAGSGYPDISANGHNYVIKLQGSNQQVDGTSASCPVSAAMFSLINAARAAAGQPALGFARPWIYKMAKEHPEAFTDMVGGNNNAGAYYSCSTGFKTVTGWDATTGWGTINFDKLLAADAAMMGYSISEEDIAAAVRSLRGSA
jgi:tripeptidyl-peptidase-1